MAYSPSNAVLFLSSQPRFTTGSNVIPVSSAPTHATSSESYHARCVTGNFVDDVWSLVPARMIALNNATDPMLLQLVAGRCV